MDEQNEVIKKATHFLQAVFKDHPPPDDYIFITVIHRLNLLDTLLKAFHGLQFTCDVIAPGGEAEKALNDLIAFVEKHGIPHSVAEEAIKDTAKKWREKFSERMARLIAMGVPPKLPPPPPPPPPRAPEVRTKIASDVHLGTRSSNATQFRSWLRGQIQGQRVILLGDVLDLWIFDANDDDMYLMKRVQAEWEQLWSELADLKNRGVDVQYVPGNHDAFLFFVEGYGRIPWCTQIVDRTPVLKGIHSATCGKRLTEVATLHYPFYALDEVEHGGRKILLTHGHYSRLGWRLMTGVAHRDAPRLFTFLTSASIAFAHKHARIFRRLAIEADTSLRVQRIEDIGVSITNAILLAYEGAENLLRMDPSAFLDVIDTAMALYFGGQLPISLQEEVKIRDALFALANMRTPSETGDMAQTWKDTMDFLENARSEQNLTLESSQVDGTFKTIPFSEFLKPQALIFGHHHKPRDFNSQIFDVGGFVGNLHTHLSVLSDGTIVREE